MKEEKNRNNETLVNIEDKTVCYHPHSKGIYNDTVLPAGMVEAIERTLSKIEDEHGPIDKFVCKELGYNSLDELYKFLNAEQIDGVAMAICQAKNGESFVIGDMGGIGKGREGAAMLGWARRQGYKPIYVTRSKDNFIDVLRDLYDSGFGDMRPFILNDIKGEKIKYGTREEGEAEYATEPTKAERESFYATGLLPENYDFLLMTYTQVNHGDPQSNFESSRVERSNAVILKDEEDNELKYGNERPILVDPSSNNYFKKANAVRKFAMGNYAILDESHEAAGNGNIADFFKSLLCRDSRSSLGLKSALFLSATFAKNPEAMTLYAHSTNIGEANVSASDLIDIVKNGGIVMQEILSRGLTESGQYIRRERTMGESVRREVGGYKTEQMVEQIRRSYNNVIELISDFIRFQADYIEPAVYAIDPIEYAKTNGVDFSKVNINNLESNVNVESFSSRLYSLKEMLLFATKAEGVADVAIEKLQQGEKPVIAFESTVEAPLNDIAKIGEELDSLDFARLIEKYLNHLFVFKVSIKNKKAKNRSKKQADEDEFKYEKLGAIELNELSVDAQNEFIRLVGKLRRSTAGLNLSPIDVISDKIRKAGYKVGEYTNRKSYIEAYDSPNDGKVGIRRARKNVKHEEMVEGFNNGDIDCLLVNGAGSTGKSFHAGMNFCNQEQRVMIYAQLFKDVNKQVQMSYRIDRTNQLQRGAYYSFISPIPAEEKLIMMYERKLKSLNANTTTSQETESDECADMLNKYGSKVVKEYLQENPEMLELHLKNDKVFAKINEEEDPTDDSIIKSALDYVTFIPCDKQEEFLKDITERYRILINSLNESGENELVSTVMKLDAKTMRRTLFSEGKHPGEHNPFAEHVVLDHVVANVLKKPMTSAEIYATVEKLRKAMLGGQTAEGMSYPNIMNRFIKRVDEYRESQILKVKKWKKQQELRRGKISAETLHSFLILPEEKRPSNSEIQNKINMVISEKKLDQATIDGTESRMCDKIYHDIQQLKGILKSSNFKPYQTVTIPTVLIGDATIESNDKRLISTGMFLGFKCHRKALTKSTIYAVYAVADGRRCIEIPLSEYNSGRLNTIFAQSDLKYGELERKTTNIKNWESITPSVGREEAYILTGNIVQAISDASKLPGTKGMGKLITYTDDKGSVKHGYLLPKSFMNQDTLPKSPVIEAFDKVMKGSQIQIYFENEPILLLRKATNSDIAMEGAKDVKERAVVLTLVKKGERTKTLKPIIEEYRRTTAMKVDNYLYIGGEHVYHMDGNDTSLENILSYLSAKGLTCDNIGGLIDIDENGMPIDKDGNRIELKKHKHINKQKISVQTADQKSFQSMASKGYFDLRQKLIISDFYTFFHAICKDKHLLKFFDNIYNVAVKFGLNLSTFNEKKRTDGSSTIAQYSPKDNAILINRNATAWYELSNEDQAHVLLHEMIHAVTSYAIQTVAIIRITNEMRIEPNPGIRLVYQHLTAEQIAASERIIEMYENAFVNPIWKKKQCNKYGLTNEKEMAAEISNKSFRNVLSKILLWKRDYHGTTRLLHHQGADAVRSDAEKEKDAEIKSNMGFVVTNTLSEIESYILVLANSLTNEQYEQYINAASSLK